MKDTELAEEAKDLLAGKQRTLLDIQPSAALPVLKNIKLYVTLDGKFDFEEQYRVFEPSVYPYGSKFSKYKFTNHDGKQVVMIYANEVPEQVANRVKDFYDWIVK
jgi:hypothetical protein